MRIAWVHPSWRDLVIDHLSSDAMARRRFLRGCGVDGVLLAVSVAGGASGRRALPLLREDIDWDLLTERVHRLGAELEPTDLVRVIQGVSAATGAAQAPRARSEALALAAAIAATVRRHWDRTREPIPVFLLAAWFELARSSGQALACPQLDRTWVQLLPASGSFSDLRDLERIDEWLALAELLHEQAPQELERFGFPAQHLLAVHDLIGEGRHVARAEPAPGLRLALLRCARRVARMVPQYAQPAMRLASILQEIDLEEEPWARLTIDPIEPAPPSLSAPRERLIQRILGDL